MVGESDKNLAPVSKFWYLVDRNMIRKFINPVKLSNLKLKDIAKISPRTLTSFQEVVIYTCYIYPIYRGCVMKYNFLALLAKSPAHGYELKQAFEQIFGATSPPLNAGQIYTTLGRLERDGLVSSQLITQEDRPDKKVYDITAKGRKALEQWLNSDEEITPPRDNFFLKLILARLAGIAEPKSLITRQRRIYLQALHRFNNLRFSLSPDPVSDLLLEGTVLHLEADLKWLDLCEERLVAHDRYTN
jgi:DNA-binding PadR family transcriptional regulator